LQTGGQFAGADSKRPLAAGASKLGRRKTGRRLADHQFSILEATSGFGAATAPT